MPSTYPPPDPQATLRLLCDLLVSLAIHQGMDANALNQLIAERYPLLQPMYKKRRKNAAG